MLMLLIGASLSKPTFNSPLMWNSDMYLYHLSCICRTLVPRDHVCPEMLRVFRYVAYLCTCVIVKTRTPEQQGPELLIVCHKDC